MYSETEPVVRHLMHDFRAQHLEFVCEARTPITFDAQPGKAIRGALYHALIRLFSPNNPIPGLPLDPVRALLESEDDDHARGRNTPRAFTVEPPAAYTEVRAESRFEFGVSLLGSAIALMPYLLRAAAESGNLGVGKGRGSFRLVRIKEFNPLNGAYGVLMQPYWAHVPHLQVTHWRVEAEARLHRARHVTLKFATPMRLIEGGHLVRTPQMGTLLRRLLERAQNLVEHDSAEPISPVQRERWKAEWQRMGQLGDAMDARGIERATRWIDIESYSQARQRSSPIGGFVGEARWPLDSFDALVWLLWGQSLHVGKNAVKGDGYFRVE